VRGDRSGGGRGGLRLELARLGTSCAGILITTATSTTSAALPTSPEGTGAEVWMPEGEREKARALPGVRPGGVPDGRTRPSIS
jgi:hypothetical protein